MTQDPAALGIDQQICRDVARCPQKSRPLQDVTGPVS
jgi:hypothetical protein